MRGLLIFAENRTSVELREYPFPEIDEGDVLASIKLVGVCGSDLRQYGGNGWSVNYSVGANGIEELRESVQGEDRKAFRQLR